MKTYLSHTILRIVQRLADTPEHTLSRVAARFSTELYPEANASPAPEYIVQRLESTFEALSELPFQRDIGAALELACDVLDAELPAQAIAAGLYNINADEIRIVAARGMEQDLLRGMVLSRASCFAGRASEGPFIASGSAGGAAWLGSGEEGAQVLLCPIVLDAHLLGVLAIAEPLCAATFDDHDVELASYVGGQLAAFIQSLRNRPSVPAPAFARGEPSC